MSNNTFFPKLLLTIGVLAVLIVLHIIPLPILELLILYVIIARPKWFKDLVDQIYNT